MKRNLLGLLVVTLVLVWTSLGLTASWAAAPAQATVTPSAGWTAGALVRVKTSKPFVWLRNAPSSGGATLATVPTGDYMVVASSNPVWDGTQWWWQVRWGSTTGYAEEQSLDLVIAGPTLAATIAPPTIAPTATAAAPTATATVASGTPGATPAAATWTTGTQVQISGVPFVWMRFSPSSTAAVSDTLYPNSVALIAGSNAFWDGTQWWWQVTRQGSTSNGWVEQSRVQLISANPTATAQAPNTTPGSNLAPATWPQGSIRAVKAGVAFVWVRSAPASNASAVLTLQPGWLVLVANGTPVWDGTQWWWQVNQPARNITGWVEQNSLS